MVPELDAEAIAALKKKFNDDIRKARTSSRLATQKAASHNAIGTSKSQSSAHGGKSPTCLW